MLNRLYLSAAAWTGLGLASGLFYREFTRQSAFQGFTQLALAHTHALALGTLMLLVVLALAKVFAFDPRRTNLFTLLWNVGLGLTFTMLVVKGSLQVLDHPLADSPALAGVSGLGHMLLAGTFVYLFVLLRSALTADASGAALAGAGAAPTDAERVAG